MPIDWSAAIQYAGIVGIAESVPPNVGYGSSQIDQIESAGYTFLQTFYGDDLATDIDSHLGDVVTFGFLGISPAGELVAAIRGTDTILEWLHDGSFLMVPSPIAGAHGNTEDGFTAVYRSLRIGRANGTQTARDSIKSYLDSGSATSDVGLNTSCHAPTAYTFASPRTGDHTFAGSYNTAIASSYRIANRQDLVTKLPPVFPVPYEHINTEYELNPPPNQIKSTIPCMHHLTTYLSLMGQLAGTAAYPLDADCAATGPDHI